MTGLRAKWRRRPWAGWSFAIRMVPFVLVGVVGGIAGFRNVGGTEALSWFDVVYRTARLFTLNLDVPEGGTAPLALKLAAVAAPLATAGFIFQFARDRFRALVMERVLRGHVVVCGVGVRGSQIVRERTKDGGVVVAIDIDPEAPGLREAQATNAWTLSGDATSRETLRRAGAGRAAQIIVITCDDYVNGAVTSAIEGLAPHAGRRPEVFAHFDEAGIARTFDAPVSLNGPAGGGPGGHRPLVPFSTTGRAAAAALDDQSLRPESRHGDAILILGDDPFVDAMVLELHRRWEAERLTLPPLSSPPHVHLLAGGASDRLARLERRFGPVWTDLELEAHDLEIVANVPFSADLKRIVRATRPVLSAWVVDRVQLAGLQIALNLSRELGPGDVVRFVSEGPVDAFTKTVADRTTDDPAMADIRADSLVELALGTAQLESNRRVERLTRAIAHQTGGDLASARVKAEEALRVNVTLVDAPAATAMRWERPVLEALGLPNVETMVRAGLRLSAITAETATVAGPALLERAKRAVASGDATLGRAASEDAFVYYARVAAAVDDPNSLLLGELRTDAALVGGDVAEDVGDLLQLRRTVLERRAGRSSATPTPTPNVEFAFVAGGAASWDGADGLELTACATRHLTEATQCPTWNGTLICGGTTSGIAGVVGDLPGVKKLGYLPRLDAIAPAQAHSAYSLNAGTRRTFSIADPLRAWDDLIASGLDPEDVPLIVYPGGSITRQEVGLALALGAAVGVVQVAAAGDVTPPAALYEDWAGVTPLSDDPMVVRAFLRRDHGHVLGDDQVRRLAKMIHENYRAKQAGSRAVDDPAMRSWEALSPLLKPSNEAQARHIPAKLESIGYQLVEGDRGARLDLGVDDASVDTGTAFSDAQLERLARMEHGRWVVERVRRGWESGTRTPLRLLTPHLVPWEQLDEPTRAMDRDAVVHLPELIEQAGMAVVRTPNHHGASA